MFIVIRYERCAKSCLCAKISLIFGFMAKNRTTCVMVSNRKADGVIEVVILRIVNLFVPLPDNMCLYIYR